MKLTWRAPPEGTAISRFEIRRNGDDLGQVKGSAMSFTDGDAVPRTHPYSIAAVSADEQRSATTIGVTTKPAPPRTAALVGTFNVRLHNTSHSGFASFGSTNFNNGSRFQPQCKEPPPSNTQMRNINNTKMVVTLKQKGGSYSGSASVAGLVSCQGHDVTSSVSVTIHAAQADAVHDAWQVTKLAGTMSQSASAQLGCTSSSASFAVTGTSLKG